MNKFGHVWYILLFMQGIGKLAKYNIHLRKFTLPDVFTRRIHNRLSIIFTTDISNPFRTFQV